ncbi:unnamed protein product [Haemonchus placei]|uniref:Phlebovirus glycoprotein G2 fusion domain-containing protein n=1 Tax=Haemonchus placei TaxID=6290 RepID=A0A0N4WX50_HAEPC|nr:unnamed protein product [Haemonchus placei]
MAFATASGTPSVSDDEEGTCDLARFNICTICHSPTCCGGSHKVDLGPRNCEISSFNGSWPGSRLATAVDQFVPWSEFQYLRWCPRWIRAKDGIPGLNVTISTGDEVPRVSKKPQPLELRAVVGLSNLHASLRLYITTLSMFDLKLQTSREREKREEVSKTKNDSFSGGERLRSKKSASKLQYVSDSVPISGSEVNDQVGLWVTREK